MDPKVAQKYKIEKHYSSINNVYTMFKEILMLITEACKRVCNNKLFPSLNVITGKSYP